MNDHHLHLNPAVTFPYIMLSWLLRSALHWCGVQVKFLIFASFKVAKGRESETIAFIKFGDCYAEVCREKFDKKFYVCLSPPAYSRYDTKICINDLRLKILELARDQGSFPIPLWENVRH